MLYGAEVWALSPAQLERLEVALRRMLRTALPPRMRRRRGEEGALSSVALRHFHGLPSVAMFLVRKSGWDTWGDYQIVGCSSSC